MFGLDQKNKLNWTTSANPNCLPLVNRLCRRVLTWFDCLVQNRVWLILPLPCPRWTVFYFICFRTTVRLRYQSSSYLSLLLSNDDAGERSKMRCSLHIYIFGFWTFFFSSFFFPPKCQHTTALVSIYPRVYCKKKKKKHGTGYTFSSLLAVRQSRACQEGEWEHTRVNLEVRKMLKGFFTQKLKFFCH